MNIQTVKLTDINPAEYNPRIITKEEFEGLKESLKTFGLTENLIVNKDMTLISGHQRLEAMKALGWKEAATNVVDLDKHQEKKLNVLMNSQAIAGKWDDTKLAEILEELKLDEDYVPLRLDALEPLDLSDFEEDEPPAVSSEPPISVLGEIYQVGRHRLMCGNSTNAEDLSKLMADKKAHMVFTDPPYNVDYANSAKDKMRGKNRPILNDKFASREDFYDFLYDAISALQPYTTGSVYICMSSSELDSLQRAFRDAGGHWSTFIIWVKNTFTMGRADYQRQYEPILYGWFEKSTHYWSGIRKLGDVIKQDDAYVNPDGEVYLKAEGIATDVWEFDKPTSSKEHPTMKPLALVARSIHHSSKAGQIVLDTFGGSGSTLIASEQTGRTCYMMELDPKYCDVIRKRYAKYKGEEEEWQQATPICSS